MYNDASLRVDARRSMPPADADALDAPVTCAICYEELSPNAADDDTFNAPCCGTQSMTSTTQFCIRCVRVVVTTRASGVGPCPRCRAPLKMDETDGRRFVLARPERACRVCRQPRAMMDVCDACEYGARHALRYRCVECGRAQVIAHPMWRYCERPGSETTTTWACHGRCGTFRRWRIVEEDVGRVPPADAPITWGAEEAWFASVREEIARRSAVGETTGRRGEDAGGRWSAMRRRGGDVWRRWITTPNRAEWVARVAAALFWVLVAVLVVVLPEGSGSGSSSRSRSSSSSSSLRSGRSSTSSSSLSSSRFRPSRSARASVARTFDDFGGANISRT